MFDIKDHLIVKDNFFSKEIYDNIIVDLSGLKFTNRYATADHENIYNKIYFNINLNHDHFAVKEVSKKLNEEYQLNVLPLENNYYLSSKHTEATPHNDIQDENNINYLNCIIFLKGKELLNSGTGFYDYDKETKEYNLNRHIGFKRNRAIIFDPSIYHASLQFNEECGSRYIMANFFKRRI